MNPNDTVFEVVFTQKHLDFYNKSVLQHVKCPSTILGAISLVKDQYGIVDILHHKDGNTRCYFKTIEHAWDFLALVDK